MKKQYEARCRELEAELAELHSHSIVDNTYYSVIDPTATPHAVPRNSGYLLLNTIKKNRKISRSYSPVLLRFSSPMKLFTSTDAQVKRSDLYYTCAGHPILTKCFFFFDSSSVVLSILNETI